MFEWSCFMHLLVHRESEWTRIQTTAAKKTLELGQIKMSVAFPTVRTHAQRHCYQVPWGHIPCTLRATHNLYVLIHKHLQRKMPAEEADKTLLQLDKVRRAHCTNPCKSLNWEDTTVQRLWKCFVHCFHVPITLRACTFHYLYILHTVLFSNWLFNYVYGYVILPPCSFPSLFIPLLVHPPPCSSPSCSSPSLFIPLPVHPPPVHPPPVHPPPCSSPSCSLMPDCGIQIQVFIKDLTEITHEIQRHESAAVPNMQLLGL